jgi:hypothetical protein
LALSKIRSDGQFESELNVCALIIIGVLTVVLPVEGVPPASGELPVALPAVVDVGLVAEVVAGLDISQ